MNNKDLHLFNFIYSALEQESNKDEILRLLNLKIKLNDKKNYICLFDYLNDIINYMDSFYKINTINKYINYSKILKSNFDPYVYKFTEFIVNYKKHLKQIALKYAKTLRNIKYTNDQMKELSLKMLNDIKYTFSDLEICISECNYLSLKVRNNVFSFIKDFNNVNKTDIIDILNYKLSIVFGIKNPIFHELFKNITDERTCELSLYVFYRTNKNVYKRIQQINDILISSWNNETLNRFNKIYKKLTKNKLYVNKFTRSETYYILFVIGFVLFYYNVISDKLKNINNFEY
jgi:hypothetical protein